MADLTMPRSWRLETKPHKFCPGCGHGLVLKALGQAIDELDIQGRVAFGCDIGCSLLSWDFFNIDTVQTHHGRTTPVMTGINRARPDTICIAYMGDGGGYAIGSQHLVNAASRNERITVVLANNTVYAMTGGQMAPTTLLGQVTTTTPYGRDRNINGCPVKVSEMLSVLDGAAYVARVSLHSPANVSKARKAIKKAFEVQMAGLGFTLVEILSTCPTNWGLSPVKALKWLEENMIPYYPLGEYKTKGDTPPLFEHKSGALGGMSPNKPAEVEQ